MFISLDYIVFTTVKLDLFKLLFILIEWIGV